MNRQDSAIAERYAYMMHPDFFSVYDADSRYRYRVGRQPTVEQGFGPSVSESIEGYGETLEEAIDMALKAASKKRIGVKQ